MLCVVNVAIAMVIDADIGMHNKCGNVNMLMLINNILPRRTSLKPRGRIFNNGTQKKIVASTHGAQLGRFQ